MRETLDRNISIPLHYQLTIVLKNRILSGEYPVRSQIPNELELCEEFNVSRPTVRKAVENLVDADLLVKKPPKGTFVCDVIPNGTDSEADEIVLSEMLPQDDAKLKVALELPLIVPSLRKELNAFQQKTGTQVSIEQCGPWRDCLYMLINVVMNGDLPDIMVVPNATVQLFAEMGIITPMDGFLDKETASALRRKIREQGNDYYLYQDKIYGYPFFSETRLMYYRKDHFREMGVEMPSEGWTHNDFLTICKQLTDPERKRWGYGFPCALDGDTMVTMMIWILQRGGEIFKVQDGQIYPLTKQPEFEEAFRWFCDLSLVHHVAPPYGDKMDYVALTDRFINGNVSMMIGLPSLASLLEKKLAPGSWGIVPLPAGPSGNNRSYLGGMPFCISSQCRKPSAAWSLISYITQKSVLFPYAKSVNVFPPLELFDFHEIEKDTPAGMRLFVREIQRARPWNPASPSAIVPSEIEEFNMPLQYALIETLRKNWSYQNALEYITASIQESVGKSRMMSRPLLRAL